MVERMPFEDSDAGLYLHEPDRVGLLEQRAGIDGEPRYYLPVQQFMEMQRERDEFRKAAALLNAWRVRVAPDSAEPRSLLAAVGLDDADGRAMQSIVDQFRCESKQDGGES